jgi:hypothetical protein
MSLVALEEMTVYEGRRYVTFLRDSWPFGASYGNFTEILPVFYDFLP